MSKVLTTCPFCGCGCGVFLEVENERVLAVAPQRSHPTSRGTLCAKGWNGHQFIHSTERLTKPLVKQNGQFKEVSWSEAIGAAADGFKKVLKSSGPEALGVVGSIKTSNEDSFVLAKFAREVLGTNNVDSSARFYHAPSVNALASQIGFAASTASLTDIENADVLLVVGSNAKDECAKAGSYVIWAARNGKKVIISESYDTEFTHFADIHLKPRPGTDVIWLNAIANWLIRENKQSAKVKGVNALAKKLEEFTFDYAEANCGIAAADLKRTAERLAGAERVVFLYATGLTQQASGTAGVHALTNLAALAGAFEKEGSGVIPLTLSNNIQGAIDVGLSAEFDAGFAPVRKKGLTLGEMLSSVRKGGVKGLYIVGENLARSAPNASTIPSVLQELDFLVVQEMFLTETAQCADVVLPACSFAEKDGTITSTERRVQRWRKAIPEIGESKPDWEITQMLAQKMGGSMKYKSAEAIFEDIAAANKWYSGINYTSLDQVGGALWPVNGSSAEVQLVQADYRPATELPDESYPFTLVTGRSYFHRLSGTLTQRSFTLAKEFLEGVVQVNTDDAKELGLRSGWKAKISTRRGSVERTVMVTRGVPAKTIYIPIHHKDGLTNALVNDSLEPDSKIPEMKVCAANMEVA